MISHMKLLHFVDMYEEEEKCTFSTVTLTLNSQTDPERNIPNTAYASL